MARQEVQDKELEAYLNGGESPAGLYPGSGGEEPPRELDARILQAAREAARGKTPRARYAAAWSLAASVLLTTTAVLMFSTLDTPRPANNPARAVPANEPVIPMEEAPGTPREQASARVAADTAPRMPPARTLPGEEQSGMPEDALMEQPAILEEIIVTGSRISRDFSSSSEAQTPQGNYRDTPENWAEEIRAMLDTGRVEAATRESELFRQRYPDADLESLLQPAGRDDESP